ncbi:MAG: helix-hairpin-helix domain-containing protein [Ignavibacteriae bacterium]|nr:helix-hairpin-helix domain-containing protein [Ignavibacteriota bacterium]MCB9206049.1 helix-hairpin-helix domain-containing protein [Ignavibacteriales bacterium]MCB9209324.1 helix-hairpin-helix domain-containing protein [Ignavibacteriales bacterium]MCB9257968.1 helix-hairpin-helix domain-containing protein [Ignavibacteriales bacterium]
MKNILNIISQKFGLTQTEIKSILFVLSILVFGIFARISKIHISDEKNQKFEYNFHDSLFNAIIKSKNSEDIQIKKSEKRVDSEAELYDFSNNKLDGKKQTSNYLKEHSININTAEKSILVLLPGIGPKTAEKIISLRNIKNGFKSLSELTEVKGIGQKKLNNIKKFLYLEN